MQSAYVLFLEPSWQNFRSRASSMCSTHTSWHCPGLGTCSTETAHPHLVPKFRQ